MAGGAALVGFPLLAGLVGGLRDHPELAPVGEALGAGAVRVSDYVAALITGFALFLVIRSGRRAWAPAWLVGLAWAPLAVAVLLVVPLSPLDAVAGGLMVPVGFATMIALGVVGLRGARVSAPA